MSERSSSEGPINTPGRRMRPSRSDLSVSSADTDTQNTDTALKDGSLPSFHVARASRLRFPEPNRDFEIRVEHIAKEIKRIEIIDGSGIWRRYDFVPDTVQKQVRSLLRQAQKCKKELEPEKLSRVREKLVQKLDKVLRGMMSLDCHREALEDLLVEGSTSLSIPDAQKGSLLLEMYHADGMSAFPKAFEELEDGLPDFLTYLSKQQDSALCQEVILCYFEFRQRLQKETGGESIASIAEHLARGLANASFQYESYETEFEQYTIKEEEVQFNRELPQLIIEHRALFSDESFAAWVLEVVRQCSAQDDFYSLFHFLEEIPTDSRPSFEQIYPFLYRKQIPDGDSLGSPMELLGSHINLFPEECHLDIAHLAVAEGGVSVIASFERDLWDLCDHKNIADNILRENGIEYLLPGIHNFSCLSMTVAEELTELQEDGRIFRNLQAFEAVPQEVALNNLDSKGRVQSILENFQVFEWSEEGALKFIEQLTESHFDLLLEHIDSLPKDFVDVAEERFHLKRYREAISVPSARIYKHFRYLSEQPTQAAFENFISQVRRLSEIIVSSKPQTSALTEHPLFPELCRRSYRYDEGILGRRISGKDMVHVENVDRSEDIAHFHFKPKYEIDLSDGVKMVLRDGKKTDFDLLERIQDPVQDAQQQLKQIPIDDRRRRDVLKNHFSRFEGFPAGADIEEGLAQMMLNCRAGKLQNDKFMKAFLFYHTVINRDELEYYQATRDRSEMAKNREYAYLLLLREFFADRLVDTSKLLSKKALQSRRIQHALPALSNALSEQKRMEERHQNLSRAQLSKRGLSDQLMQNIARILRSDKHKQEAKLSIVAKMIRSEQNKIAKLASQIGSLRVSADDIHLGNFDLAKLVESSEEAEQIGLAQEDFPHFFMSCFDDLLTPTVSFIDQEIKKFKREQGEKRQARKLEAFFTKNHSSLFARNVAGVCVAADGPSVVKEKIEPPTEEDLNHDPDAIPLVDDWPMATTKPSSAISQWDLPNYFQLVFRDPELRRCEGLVLLHHYEDQGKRILTASLNPSSTYLYKINERHLFNGILEVLIDFAERNDFDCIATSRNPGIRTNRIGGAFSAALQERISSVGERLTLSSAQTFSFNPNYEQQEFDLIWKKSERKK